MDGEQDGAAAGDTPSADLGESVSMGAPACEYANGFAYSRTAMHSDADRTDEQLMLAYRDGDAAAFDALYLRHKGGVYRYLLRQCASRAEAEELFQDIWLSVVRARREYTVQAKFATYLYRIAHNRLIDHYRRQPKGIPVSFDDDDCAGLQELEMAIDEQPEARLDARRQLQHFRLLLAQLPEAQREAFLLHQESDMTLDQIAAATGVARETAKSRLRYALARLRKGMAGLT